MTSSVPASMSRFVWRDLMTTRVDEAKDFYAMLFGWEVITVEMAGDEYDIFRSGDHDVGGIMPVGNEEEIASHWLAYLCVPDVFGACSHARENGGSVKVDPVEYPEVGITAVVADPSGALFAPFEKRLPDDVDHDAPPPELTFCWTELLCEAPEKVVPFYAGLVGWGGAPVNGGHAAHVFTKGEAPVAGARAYPADQVARALWLNYVSVPDCAQWFERALKLGAEPVHEPTTLPGRGDFAVVIDPVGAVLALWKPLT